jgi:hypothetical protein
MAEVAPAVIPYKQRMVGAVKYHQTPLRKELLKRNYEKNKPDPWSVDDILAKSKCRDEVNCGKHNSEIKDETSMYTCFRCGKMYCAIPCYWDRHENCYPSK